MKRLFLFGALVVASLSLVAQSLPPSGYYRVQSVRSNRYICILDDYGSLNYQAANADMGALRTFAYNEDDVISNPGTVIYAEFMGGNKYNLHGQGTSVSDISGHVLQIQANSDGTYSTFASMSGITKYLYEYDSDFGSFGGVGVSNYSATNKAFRWNVLPISSGDDTNYFGIKPNIQVGSDWYRSLNVAFNYSFASSGMQAFYVTKVDAAKGMAVYEEITGSVPKGTPVYVKCATNKPSDNRLNILTGTVAAISNNRLTGVYFCSTPNDAMPTNKNHIDALEYDENTMRLLGKTSDGSLGFVKAPDSSLRVEKGIKYVPANSAYLIVDRSAPAELKLVSKEEYEEASTPVNVTVTAKNYTRVYGDANPTFEYTADGTFTGVPELKCEATATSPVGTYPITVTQGTVTGATVIGVAGTLTITAAPLTVTAQAASREYGAANPAFTFTYSGWKNGETDAVLTKKPTAACAATATSPVGTYDITVSGGEAKNYAFTYVPAKLTVNKATLNVKADDKTRSENTDNPVFTLTYTGFKNNETEAVLDTKPTATTTATKTSAPGNYPITVSGGSAKNYNLTYTNGTLTITSGTLVLTAKSYTRVYGDENPTFEFEQSGSATLRGTPSITCSATKTSPVGTYDIVIAKGTVENEGVTYVNGKLTITPAELTVTANDASREYGDENPALTVSYNGFKNSDTEAALATKPTASTSATKASDVAIYVISVSGGAATNYTLKYVPGKLTVNKAVLTVKANDAERQEGEPNPEFTLTYSGWKNNQTEAVLTKKPVATTTADETSTPGEYPITVSGGEATNYAFNYVAGKLTVTEKDGIEDILGDAATFNVYTVSGYKVRSNTTTLQGLPAGIYVINGKKVIIK